MHAKPFNNLTTMNGRVANWKSERIVLPGHLVVGSLEAVVVSLVLVAGLGVVSVAAVVALEDVGEGLVVAMVGDVAVVLVAAVTTALPHQEPVILLLYPQTTLPTMLQVAGTAALQFTSAM